MAIGGVRPSAARAYVLLSGAGSSPGLPNVFIITMPHTLYDFAILSRPSILRTI